MRLPCLGLVALTTVFAVLGESSGAEESGSAGKVDDVPYRSPSPSGPVYFAEHFDDVNDFDARWVRSQAKKEGIDEDIAKYDGKWAVESAMKDALRDDRGLVLKSKAKHAAISAFLDRPFHFTSKPLVVQYDVTLQEGQDCGGAYIKLLTHETGARLSQFTDKTPYTIMFGPDKCGNDHKLHFIFQHKNPKNGTITEKHAKKADGKLDDYFKDRKPHLYTLVVNPDNTYEISVDYKVVNHGTLLDDFSPPVNPPSEIDDPEDRKPEDWDEREKIPDPDAVKPDDWDEDEPEKIPDPAAKKPAGWLDDEPETVPDPTAEKPEDWDEDMDGTWEAPQINNPACESATGCGTWKAPLIDNPRFKGKWRPPMIDNPNYRGKWRPKRIPNPDFFEDRNPFKMSPIGAVGLELWSMSDNILFDNIIITDDKGVADAWAAETFDLKRTVVDADQVGLGQVKLPAHWVQRWRRWANNSQWAWPVYGVTAFSPAFCFLVYLCVWAYRDPQKGSLVERVIRYTNKNPWLWGVYVVVVALPIVLLFSYLCSSSQDKRAKKDDAITEDDKEPLLEEDEEEENLVEREGEAEEDDDEEDKEVEETEEVQEESPVPEKQSPRRRRTRKE